MDFLVSSEPRGYLKKAAIFLFAVVFHVVGFYFLLHAKFHYKIYQYEPRVAVLLAPPEIIRVPKLPRRLTEAVRPPVPVVIRPGQKGEPAPAEASAKAGQIQSQELAGRGVAGGGAAQGGQAGGSGAAGGTAGPAAGGQVGALASGFALTFPSGTALNLSKPSGSSLESYLNPRGYQAGASVDFSKYLRSGISSLLPSGPGGGKPGGGSAGTGGQAGGASVSINVKAIDLAPWANIVLNRIQRNWSVAQSEGGTTKGEVQVSVLIAKNGDLLAVEVGISSKIDVLDQAALKAVNLSGPFPPLPVNFPNDSLSMDFVFQYGD